MTREAKKLKKLKNAKVRREKRMSKYVAKIQAVRDRGIPRDAPLSTTRWGSWQDSSSPTGFSQVCDWFGTCQFPCNGDC